MNKNLNNIVKASAIAMSLGLLLTAMPVGAHTDPALCFSTGPSLLLTVFRADGTTPVGGGSVTPGETIKYEAMLTHSGPPQCNYGGGTLSITTPDGATDVTGGLGAAIISLGFPFVSVQVSYVVDSAEVGGDGDIDASATYAGGTSHLGGGDVSPVGATTPAATPFEKLNPGVVTEIHNASEAVVVSVPAGTTVHDKATVSGTVAGGTPTGTVDFTFYTASDACTGPSVGAGNVALVGGVAHPSTSQGPLGAGAYSFRAHYNGDANYNPADSACEPLTVTKLNPDVVTEIHDAGEAVVVSVPAGSTVHDQATVSGSYSTPTGTVDFTWYTDGNCTPEGSPAGNVALNGSGVAHPSDSQGPLNAGSYSFRAHYNGDTNYNPTDSACEPLEVTQLKPLVVTEIHDGSEAVITSVPAGTTVHDKATVSGSFGTPTGNVDFTFFTNGSCTPTGSAAGNVALDGSGVAHPSTSQGPLGTGSYSFQAHYNGDINYIPADSDCEPLDVTQFRSAVETQVHDSNHLDITGQFVPVGTIVHDKATVIGGGPVPTGSVSFDLWADPNCSTQTIIPTEIVSLDLSGMAESSPVPGLPVGSYGYLVAYSGDQVYLPSQGICEPFHIVQLESRVETQVHDTNHLDITNQVVPIGTQVHDKATVLGVGPIPTGTITFNLYSTVDCTGQFTVEGPIPLDLSGMAESTPFTPAAGPLSYLVSYSGDQTYFPSEGVCEPLTVSGPTRTLGFWQTHLQLASSTLSSMDAAERLICDNRDIDNTAELMGGFWSSIPYKTTGVKRSQVDQARMQLIQQLLAAMLNKEAFGTNDGGLIATGKAAFCTSNKASILASAGALGAFNESGDLVPIPVAPGPADPQAAQSLANKVSWNTLPGLAD